MPAVCRAAVSLRARLCRVCRIVTRHVPRNRSKEVRRRGEARLGWHLANHRRPTRYRGATADDAIIAVCETHNKFPCMAAITNETILPRDIGMSARSIQSAQKQIIADGGERGASRQFHPTLADLCRR
jgi:hypothetical protein